MTQEQKSKYYDRRWIDFRREIIKNDNYICSVCGQNYSDKPQDLQVHHRQYEKGKMPWEYGIKNFDTLCKGCHLKQHQGGFPPFGWEYIGVEDLEDIDGTCERPGCGKQIRYAHSIFHPEWGFIVVGSTCADKLTSTKYATDADLKKSRKKEYLCDTKWKEANGVYHSDFNKHSIDINCDNSIWHISINNELIDVDCVSLEEAKEFVFNFIYSGDYQKWRDECKIEEYNDFDLSSRWKVDINNTHTVYKTFYNNYVIKIVQKDTVFELSVDNFVLCSFASLELAKQYVFDKIYSEEIDKEITPLIQKTRRI